MDPVAAIDLHDLAALHRRLRVLEADRAILAVLARYASTLDYGDPEGCADCFTPDAVVEVRLHDAPPIALVGRPMILANFAQHTHAPHRWHKHLVTQPEISLGDEAREAECSSYMVRIDRDRRDGDLPKVWAFGRYVDRLMCDAEGTWRITRRVVEIEAVQPMQFNVVRPAP